MRPTTLLSTTGILLAVLLVSIAQGAKSNDQAWSVGYAEVDITPEPRQVQMSGFGRERYAEGTLAPLLAQVLILQDRDGSRGVLITADVLDFDRVMVEAIRLAITHRHGIPPENIMLAA